MTVLGPAQLYYWVEVCEDSFTIRPFNVNGNIGMYGRAEHQLCSRGSYYSGKFEDYDLAAVDLIDPR